MHAARQASYLVFLLAGAVVLLGPVARELDPTNVFARALSLEQFLALELHAGLIAFWCLRGSRGPTLTVPLLLAAAALASGAFMVPYFGSTDAVFLTPTPAVIGFGSVTILLVLMSAFSAAGQVLTLIVAGFLVLGFLGQFAQGWTGVPQTHLTSYITYLAYGSDGLFGRAVDIIVNVVLVFVIFGVFFDLAGGGRVVSNVALRLAGRSRASAIKACVLASGLLGTISGAAMSNVMTSGTFSLPSMRRIGVRNDTAAGIEAAASTCGQIMPPVLGAAAFFLADLVSVSYGTVVLASIGPAVACYFAFFRQADLVPLSAAAEEQGDLTAEAYRPIWLLYLLPPAVILLYLLHSSEFVSRAAIAGAGACLAVSLVVNGWRETVRGLQMRLPALIQSGMTLVVVAATVGLLLGVLYSTGLAIAGAVWVGKIAGSNLVLALALTAVSAFVLGMGVATVGVYIVAATLLAPGLIAGGLPPMAAHFFVLYCGILSMITPPVAFASLAASALAGSDFNRTSLAAMRFGWVLFAMPFLIALQPGILLVGSWSEIAVSFLTIYVFIHAVTSRVRAQRWLLAAVAAAAVCLEGSLAIALALSVIGCQVLLPRVLPQHSPAEENA
ncbi:TRAP transporter permease [Algicella marina]|uniref:TRAP transporter fused permease subunit n=1 Tax=Algicella marina TaxID=2683284 RepID=A0A6P1SZZ8_9RHOB|nr:TRAP transporter fused permease subunit [Algicella marina]QHQ36058.1 TRAP transporter fused permease subunit [Algicella marina]